MFGQPTGKGEKTMKGMTLGQYYPADSVLHRMDPRIKILCTIAFIVASFLCVNFFAFILLVASAVALIFLSRIPLEGRPAQRAPADFHHGVHGGAEISSGLRIQAPTRCFIGISSRFTRRDCTMLCSFFCALWRWLSAPACS